MGHRDRPAWGQELGERPAVKKTAIAQDPDRQTQHVVMFLSCLEERPVVFPGTPLSSGSVRSQDVHRVQTSIPHAVASVNLVLRSPWRGPHTPESWTGWCLKSQVLLRLLETES